MSPNISHTCILSCENKSCYNNSTETFKRIICPYHLSAVFGLKVVVNRFESTSESILAGPFLQVDENFHFEPKTVIFPERKFIDIHIGLEQAASDEFYNYSLNPRMREYLNGLVQSQFKLSDRELRYQFEIIRNLFLGETKKIELSKNTEPAQKDLSSIVNNRINEMNQLIETEDYQPLFGKMKYMNASKTQLTPFDDVLPPFMKFILLNCLSDEHKLPFSITGIGITAYANMLYKEGYGFISLTTITHPLHLIFAGETIGNNHLYQAKLTPITKRTVCNTSVNMKDLADNRRISNIISNKTDYCHSTWRNS